MPYVAGILAALGITGAQRYKDSRNLLRGKKRKYRAKKTIVRRGKRGQYSKIQKKRGRKKGKSAVGRLKSDVRELKRITNQMTSKITHRNRYCVNDYGTVNGQAMSSFDSISRNKIELAMQNLLVYNRSTGNLDAYNAATGGVSKKFLFKNIYAKIHLRNNYQAPLSLMVYGVSSKADTSLTAVQAITNGFNDLNGISGITQIQAYPTDSPQFNDLFKIRVSKKVNLESGKCLDLSMKIPDFVYDPALSDTHVNEYQRVWHGGIQWLVVVHGEFGHNSNVAPTEYGAIKCRYEGHHDVRFDVIYDGEADFHDFRITDDCNLVADGVTGAYTVPDLVGFSAT